MPVLYDNKKLIPVQDVQISKQYSTTGDGKRIGKSFDINVNGMLVYYKGSPDSNGTFWTGADYPPDETIPESSRLTAILRKQEALRTLFATEGRTFEVYGFDGMAPMKCNPRLSGPIRFESGPWINYCKYTIPLQADVLYLNGGSLGEDSSELENYSITNYDEDWSIEPDDFHETYKISRRLSATGKRFYDDTGALTKPGWERAKEYITEVVGVGFDSTFFTQISSGIYSNLDTYLPPYDYKRVQSVNEAAGTFGIQESWTLLGHTGIFPATEEYTVSIRQSLDGLTKVNVEGNIKGLEYRDNNYNLIHSKIVNATGYFLTYVDTYLWARAQETLTSTLLHPVPLNLTNSYNKKTGTFNYSREYDDRATNLYPGAVNENIQVTFENPGRIVAEHIIPQRLNGPLLQDIQANTKRVKNLNIEIGMGAATTVYTPAAPSTDSIVALYVPAGTYVFTTKDTESWDVKSGRYTRQVSWSYEV